MNSVITRYECISLSQNLQSYISASIDLAAVPEHAERIALNFRNSHYRSNRTGAHPVEIHLFRKTTVDSWKIATMTSFAFPNETSNELDVELNFNFSHQWFYQPDIKRCDLNQPEVIDLFQSWQRSLVNVLRNGAFDFFAVTVIKPLPQTTH
ncbi:DUF2787 domain-containing protein [Vibrio sp. ZSDZ65]|uniref:DUF2787 domain-containing protein n=1 Tax=Vibrio qingdaonensis TaxID=2829491 RepID=A0A9X3CNB9_9VIBR|nr:DUF2787 family protein [Vibrio qingdaonensis]MCW8346558.1 DUF2787 domain-containing protein [Vibrio qingdaonensis]